MNKTDAAKYLNIGVRSLERYTSDGRIFTHKIKGKTGPALDYAPEELERFKAELEAPPPVPPTPPPSLADPDERSSAASPASSAARPATQSGRALARLSGSETFLVPAATRGAAGRERPLVPVEHKLLLTLPEAQALTGLSRGALKTAIDAGQLQAATIGRAWRIKRRALEQFVEEL